jgi:hypothetical protein
MVKTLIEIIANKNRDAPYSCCRCAYSNKRSGGNRDPFWRSAILGQGHSAGDIIITLATVILFGGMLTVKIVPLARFAL